MVSREIGLSLVTAAWITALAGEALGKPEEDQATARATRNVLMVVAGNTRGPPGKFLPPPPPGTLQRAPEGTAQKLIDAQSSRAIRRGLFRKHYQRPGQDYCKRNSHRTNCQR
jgi:hypothetical protein